MIFLSHLGKKEPPQVLVYLVDVAGVPMPVAVGPEVLAHVVPTRGRIVIVIQWSPLIWSTDIRSFGI